MCVDAVNVWPLHVEKYARKMLKLRLIIVFYVVDARSAAFAKHLL